MEFPRYKLPRPCKSEASKTAQLSDEIQPHNARPTAVWTTATSCQMRQCDLESSFFTPSRAVPSTSIFTLPFSITNPTSLMWTFYT